MSDSLSSRLWRARACGPAVDWVGDRSIEESWHECRRGDWLLWYAVRTHGADPRLLTRAACACVRTALPLLPASDQISLLEVIETTESWARGEVTHHTVAFFRELGLADFRVRSGYGRCTLHDAACEAVDAASCSVFIHRQAPAASMFSALASSSAAADISAAPAARRAYAEHARQVREILPYASLGAFTGKI